jgi:hypothetical protein
MKVPQIFANLRSEGAAMRFASIDALAAQTFQRDAA